MSRFPILSLLFLSSSPLSLPLLSFLHLFIHPSSVSSGDYTIPVTVVNALVAVLLSALYGGTPGLGSVGAGARPGGLLMNCGMYTGSLVIVPSQYRYGM